LFPPLGHGLLGHARPPLGHGLLTVPLEPTGGLPTQN